MPSQAVIRSAVEEDAEALSALGRQTFIDTFVTDFGIPYPPEDLHAYLDSAFDIDKTRKRLADPQEAWWVADHDGEIVGFANAGPCGLPHPESSPSHAELRRLYIARRAQGAGHGTRLLREALGWMEAHTSGPLWIGVWSGNVRAQRLYAHYGFATAGGYKYPVGKWLDDELILRKG